jgi:hypothetical protein
MCIKHLSHSLKHILLPQCKTTKPQVSTATYANINLYIYKLSNLIQDPTKILVTNLKEKLLKTGYMTGIIMVKCIMKKNLKIKNSSMWDFGHYIWFCNCIGVEGQKHSFSFGDPLQQINTGCHKDSEAKCNIQKPTVLCQYIEHMCRLSINQTRFWLGYRLDDRGPIPGRCWEFF